MFSLETDKLTRREFLGLMGKSLAAGAVFPKLPFFWQDFLSNQEKNIEKKYRFLNGGCLLLNHHELLFLPDLGIIGRDIGYCSFLGAGVIRVFATDSNFGFEWTGEKVGRRIGEIAPLLRAYGVKLIVALVNNHRPVPGEEKEAFGFFDGYDQLTQAFYEGIWKNSYKRYVLEIIQTVKNLRCSDVIFAWEPVNEGHTPKKPEVFLKFFREITGFILSLDGRTLVGPGTMGIHHLDPWQPNSKVGLEFYSYLKTIGSFITLHAYDLVVDEEGKVVESGDMPVHWDFELLARNPRINIPVIVEEIGTSRKNRFWGEGQQNLRYQYEVRAVEYFLQHGAVGFGPWSGCVDTKWGDSWRGISSFGSGEDSIFLNWQSQSLRANLEKVYMGLPRLP